MYYFTDGLYQLQLEYYGQECWCVSEEPSNQYDTNLSHTVSPVVMDMLRWMYIRGGNNIDDVYPQSLDNAI